MLKKSEMLTVARYKYFVTSFLREKQSKQVLAMPMWGPHEHVYKSQHLHQHAKDNSRRQSSKWNF